MYSSFILTCSASSLPHQTGQKSTALVLRQESALQLCSMAVSLAQCNRFLFKYPFLFATLLAFSRTIFSHDGFAIMIVDHHEVLGLRAKQKEEEEDLDGTTGEKVQAASVSRIRLYSGGWALSKGGLSRFK